MDAGPVPDVDAAPHSIEPHLHAAPKAEPDVDAKAEPVKASGMSRGSALEPCKIEVDVVNVPESSLYRGSLALKL